ncbi:MAG TPA: FMN-binding protein [Pseudonocardiaceae bacterium]|nr:FMN-binding protein [Pseudonocardiaceae bacterium]
MSTRPPRRTVGLAALLAGVGLVVAAKAATDPAEPLPAAVPPATPPQTVPQRATTPSPTPSPTPSTAPVGRRTVDGDVVSTPYGPVQVAVVIERGRIADVRTLHTPSAADRSVRLAELATPILRQEVLTAQSARIDTVSGATYTSEGYAQSVQYALDHAPG